MGRFCSGRVDVSCVPRLGGSVAFADPHENALEADVFWWPAAFLRVLRAHIRAREDPGFGSLLSLADLPCRSAVLKTVDGAQHLLLRDHGRVTQLLCRGADLRMEPFSLELVVDRFPDVEGRLRLVEAMADIYRQRRSREDPRGWSVEAMRHRDALVAVDLRRQGRPFQGIARFLQGDKFVDEDWTNPNATLKNRTIRSYKRGIRFMGGDYRKLLM